jgi:hypothetical protein
MHWFMISSPLPRRQRRRHPLKFNPKPKKDKISTNIKDDLWIQQFGDVFNGNCICCDSKITPITDQCCHIKSENNGVIVHVNNLFLGCTK